MTDSTSPEYASPQTERVVSPETVVNWLEVGRPKDAPLLLGMSLQRLRKSIDTGVIHPTRVELDFQEEITQHEKNLYYFFPLIDQLEKSLPDFASQYQSKAFSKEEYAPQELERRSAFYAFTNVLESGFKEETNLSHTWSTILNLSHEVLPETTAEDSQLRIYRGIAGDQGEKEVDDLLTILGENKSREIASKLLKRRGFLVYLKPAALTNPQSTLHLGTENPEEVMLTSKEPLSATLISGVVPLSSTDKDDLEGLIR